MMSAVSPRERNTDVFQADDTGNYKQAVGVNEVGDRWHEDRWAL